MSKYLPFAPRLTLSPSDIIHLQIYQLFHNTITQLHSIERKRESKTSHSLQCYKLCCLNFHEVEIKMSCKINYTKIKTQMWWFYLGYFLWNPAHPGQGIDMTIPRTVVTSLPVEMHDDGDDVCLSYWSPALMTRTGLLSQSVVAAAAVFVFILITPSQFPFVTFYFLLQTISL